MAKDKAIFIKTDSEFRNRVVEVANVLGKTLSQFVREAIEEKIQHELSTRRFDLTHNVEEFLQRNRGGDRTTS